MAGWGAAVAVVAAALGAGGAALLSGNSNSPVATWAREPIRFTIPPPNDTLIDSSLDLAFAASPDGSEIVFVAISRDGTKRLWLREFDSETSRLLAGTEDASGLYSLK